LKARGAQSTGELLKLRIQLVGVLATDRPSLSGGGIVIAFNAPLLFANADPDTALITVSRRLRDSTALLGVVRLRKPPGRRASWSGRRMEKSARVSRAVYRPVAPPGRMRRDLRKDDMDR
jgi:hypothetical protein